MFAGDPDPYTDDSDRKDMHALMVTPSAGVTAHVGETAKGGPPTTTATPTAPATMPRS